MKILHGSVDFHWINPGGQVTNPWFAIYQTPLSNVERGVCILGILFSRHCKACPKYGVVLIVTFVWWSSNRGCAIEGCVRFEFRGSKVS